MLSLEEAQARLLALAPQTAIIESECTAAQGHHLARDLTAQRTQPAADLSAMDGYAICGDGPWAQVGESKAGTPYDGGLTGGECTRISTGAHMPKGSDRVLIQENADVSGASIALTQGETMPEANRHVRAAGFDFAAGDVVLKQGTRMGAAQIALALSAGHDTVPHRVSPAVSVLDSGSELVHRAADCAPHQIPASNGAMITAMMRPYVGAAQSLGPVPDDMDALAEALNRATGDILITSGGASVGDHDLMQDALKAWGAKIDFWKVAIKPGKPLMVATRDGDAGPKVILGLPGNPVSSFVTAFLFALPLVRAAMGDPNPLPRVAVVKAGEALPAVGPRREFLRGISDGRSAKQAASQDSSALRALASANCLIDRPAGSREVAIGDALTVYDLDNG